MKHFTQQPQKMKTLQQKIEAYLIENPMYEVYYKDGLPYSFELKEPKIQSETFTPVVSNNRFSLSWLTRNTYLTSCPFTAALVVFSGTMALLSVVMLLANLFINL